MHGVPASDSPIAWLDLVGLMQVHPIRVNHGEAPPAALPASIYLFVSRGRSASHPRERMCRCKPHDRCPTAGPTSAMCDRKSCVGRTGGDPVRQRAPKTACRRADLPMGGPDKRWLERRNRDLTRGRRSSHPGTSSGLRDVVVQGAEFPGAGLELDHIIQRLVPRLAVNLTAGREHVASATVIPETPRRAIRTGRQPNAPFHVIMAD